MKKKLFISCPMKGRTKENIRKSMDQMHRIAEIVFDQELEVISTLMDFIPDETKNESIWCLGRSIQLLAEADFFIGIEYSDFYRGCEVERSVASGYGIKCTYVNFHDLMPDAVEVVNEYWRSLAKEEEKNQKRG